MIESLGFTTAMTSPKSSITIWDSLSQAASQDPAITSMSSLEPKMPRSTLPTPRNTKNTFKLDWEEGIPMMGSNNISITIAKFYLSRFCGVMIHSRADIITLPSITSWLTVLSKLRKFAIKTLVGIRSPFSSANENFRASPS